MITSYSRRDTPPPLARALAAFAAGVFLFIGFGVVIILFLKIIYIDRVYPGVQVSGIELGGVRKSELDNFLAEKITFPKTGLIVFDDQGKSWLFTPEDLGLHLDTIATADAIYKTGREGWPWEQWGERLLSWRDGKKLPPIMVFDERTAQTRLNEIAAQVNQPPREAYLIVNGLEVSVSPGQIGRMVDVDATLTILRNQLFTLQDGSIPLQVQEFIPAILDANAQAAQAQNILSQPMTLRVPGGDKNDTGPWVFDRETLASMLVIDRVIVEGVEQYQVGLDSNKLYNFLYPLSPGLTNEAVNARFIFNDDTRQLDLLERASIGRELMIEESIEYINQKLRNGAHEINLVFDYTNPEVTDDASAEDLGISELVSVQTSYFYGSSTGRIQNIITASSQFHGLLIPPGATFSMVENLGDIDLDSGYAEALIIYGDRTIKGVGGGVCQVSTTLFRTVFFGGFPVVERHPHAYRVTYYELIQSGAADPNLAGLDATVYAPIIDFKFTNDTPYWLLMETYVNESARSLTWKFYSTSDGRTVDWSTTGLTNVVQPPKPVYEENDELKKGVIKKVDWAVAGADVSVTRTVWRDGQVYFEDVFKTKYTPWATVCEYGPETEDYPPPKKKQQIDSCQPKKKKD